MEDRQHIEDFVWSPSWFQNENNLLPNYDVHVPTETLNRSPLIDALKKRDTFATATTNTIPKGDPAYND